MADQKNDDTHSEQEVQRRMDAALKRALNTPHQPHKAGRTKKDEPIPPKRSKPRKKRT